MTQIRDGFFSIKKEREEAGQFQKNSYTKLLTRGTVRETLEIL